METAPIPENKVSQKKTAVTAATDLKNGILIFFSGNRRYLRQLISWLRESPNQLLALTLISFTLLPVLSFLSIRDGLDFDRKRGLMQKQSKILAEKISQINQAAETLAPFTQDKELVYRAMPDEEAPAALLNKIGLILGQEKLVLRSLRIDKVEGLESERVSAINVNLEFLGLYPNISAVLRNFEKSDQQFDMQSLRISRRLQDEKLEVNLVLKTYYYKAGDHGQ